MAPSRGAVVCAGAPGASTSGLFSLDPTTYHLACLADVVSSSPAMTIPLSSCHWFASDCSTGSDTLAMTSVVDDALPPWLIQATQDLHAAHRRRRQLAPTAPQCLHVPSKSGSGSMYGLFQIDAQDTRLVMCKFDMKTNPNDATGCLAYTDSTCTTQTDPSIRLTTFQMLWPHNSPWTLAAYETIKAGTTSPPRSTTLPPKTTKQPTSNPPTTTTAIATDTPSPPAPTAEPTVVPPPTSEPSSPLPPTTPPATQAPTDEPTDPPIDTTPPRTRRPSTTPVTTPVPEVTSSAPSTTSPPTATPDPPKPTTIESSPITTSFVATTITPTEEPTLPVTTTRTTAFANISSVWTCCLSFLSTLYTPARVDGGANEVCLVAGTDVDCRAFPSLRDCDVFLQAQPACLFDETCNDGVRIRIVRPATKPPPSMEAPPKNEQPNGSSSMDTAHIIMWTLAGLLGVVFSTLLLVYYRHHAEKAQQDKMLDSLPLHTDKGGLRSTPHSTSAFTSRRTLYGPSVQSAAVDAIGGGDDDVAVDFGDLPLWRLDETFLSMHKVVSVGTQSLVARGDFKGRPVAIKKLSSERSTAALRAFVDELKLLATLDSPYIVSMVGVCWDRPREVVLVMDLMAMGDLRTYLTRSSAAAFPWSHKIDCAGDISHGLVYLHSLDLVHGDLKSRNVLLSAERRAKLADFGRAKATSGSGSFRYAAPEVLAGKRYNDAADVYSLGMILWELDAHELPYASLQRANHWSDDMLFQHLQDAPGIHVSDACPPPIRALIAQCTAYDPEARPSAIQLATMFDEIKKGERQPSMCSV
ncbi:Aste57867_10218 [Aphanomyces stellatus]|uniref:Aste57867_10218 protein n=1 Tax=Aphanomyces stellatus TaxID=120398 RepID=A0A485KQG1_9STRA|nr:hypothetical protein As57867_010179 [Aphanomyces stellatus]VFT87094.1 Aste57867_10218 [Aphanomyces stellatus]